MWSTHCELTEGEGSVPAALDIENTFYFFTQQATQMRWSNIQSLPLQLVFPALTIKLFNADTLSRIDTNIESTHAPGKNLFLMPVLEAIVAT